MHIKATAGMIDIHSHILYGVDDGAKSLRLSLEMAGLYEKCGFSHVVATPHYMFGTPWVPSPETIREKVDALNIAIIAAGISLNVHAGMEIALDPEVPRLIREKKVVPLAGSSFFLIEPPLQRLPAGWDDLLFSLSDCGIDVVLAHPERCAGFLEKPELLEKLVSSGIYVQVNWSSLLGFHGGRSKKLAMKLARKGSIHFLATDSHDPEKRSCEFVKSRRRDLEETIGEDNIRILTESNPARIFGGNRPERMVPIEAEGEFEEKRGRKGLFEVFFKWNRRREEHGKVDGGKR